MNYETDVRLVYTHTEGDGRHYDIHVFHKEAILILGTGLRIESRVIRKCLDSVNVKELGHFLHLLSA